MAAYPVRTVRRGRCRPRGTSAVRHRHLLSKQKAYQPRREARLVWHKGSRKGLQPQLRVQEQVIIKMTDTL